MATDASLLEQAQVWLYDPFCYTPWYTAELASAYQKIHVNLRLFCGTLIQEPTYFQQRGLSTELPLSLLSRVDTVGIKPINQLARLTRAIANIHRLKHGLSHKIIPLPKVLHMQQLPLLDHGFTNDFMLIEAAQRRGVPVIHTAHNLLPHHAGEQARPLYNKLYHHVDHLICHSNYAAERLTSEFSIHPNRISVIPHGPLFPSTSPGDRTDSIAARKRLKLPLSRTIVLWQGILAEYKGLDTLLNAWQHYLDNETHERQGPLLLVAGTGSANAVSTVRRRAREMPESVRAELRYIAASELPDFYASADVLVYPYRAITTSGALLTGLTYQKPIVASNLAAFREYLTDGENALLIKPDDVDALGKALLQILPKHISSRPTSTQSSHQDMFARLSAGAEHNGSRYVGWDSIAAQTLALYDSLCS